MIDFEKLLEKYVRHVDDSEGATFIGKIRHDRQDAEELEEIGVPAGTFTDEEIAHLEALDDKLAAEWHAEAEQRRRSAPPAQR